VLSKLQAFWHQPSKTLQFLSMKPKKSPHHDRQNDLFRIELCRIVDPSHELIKLAYVVDWDRLDELFGSTYCPDTGRPAVMDTQERLRSMSINATAGVRQELVAVDETTSGDRAGNRASETRASNGPQTPE